MLGLPRRLAIPFVALLLVALVCYGGPAAIEMARGGKPPDTVQGGWAQAPLLQKDSEMYLDVARDISDGSLDGLHLRTTGYPLILCLTGSAHKPARPLFFFSLLCHLAAVWLLAVLLSLGGVARPLIVLFGVLALLPPMVEPTAFVMTEGASQTMIVLGMTGTAFGLIRRQLGWLVAGAFGLGYAGLIHPLYQALSLVMIVTVLAIHFGLPWARLSLRRAIASSAVLLLGFVVLIGGALAYNFVKFRYVGLTPFTGFALSTKTVRVVEHLPDEYREVREVLVAARDADLIKPGSSHTALSYIWRARDGVSRVTGLEGAELSNYLVKLNLRLIREEPLSYLQEAFATAAGFWSPTSGQGIASMNSGLLHALWAMIDLGVIVLFWLTLILVMGATALARVGRLQAMRDRALRLGILSIRARTIGYALALAAVVYTTGITSFFGPGLTRYRAPVMPLVLFLCVAGVDSGWRLMRRPDPRH